MRLMVPSFLVLALAGCVSDSGQAGPKQGDLGGPCFANNTCNTNLACVLVSGAGVCQQPDATAGDAVADQGVADSTTSDASDASASGDADAGTPCSATPTMACPNLDCLAQTQECCAQSGACVVNSTGCNSQPTWTCTAKSQCPNAFCCIAGSVAQQNTCPPTWMTNGGASCSANVCTSSFYEVCTTNSECPSSRPTCTTVQLQGMNSYVGLCM
ncbi:MAG TPA: hypothetical protein VLM85_05655 [Polyangiaceae bacterium]|nr:hypothetical protein [Polyangiaceae bacterium]